MTFLRYDFTIDLPIVGLAMNSARGGETVNVETRAFYTSDDGPLLYTHLDAFYGTILARGVPLRPEQLHTVLVSITDGINVTAIVNPRVVLNALSKGAIEAGSPVLGDHLADISSMLIPGYPFPSRGAVALLMQHGWRRGFYFDFTANAPGVRADDSLGDLSVLFGSLYAAMMFRERLDMEQAILEKMARAGWFPFTRLTSASAMGLYRHFENNWDPREAIAGIVQELTPQIGAIVESWSHKHAFAAHMEVLRTGARLYEQGEYLGAASTVLPKLEGVLRHIYQGTANSPRSPELRRHLLGRVRASVDGYTALLPESFVQFLEIYYYAGFDLAAGTVPPSRHAFMHGVGPDDELKDPSYFLRLLLTLDQIHFCLSRVMHAET